MQAIGQWEELGDGKRMQDMMLIEVVDVLAADDIDLGIPVAIKGIECLQLLALCLGEIGEIFEYLYHRVDSVVRYLSANGRSGD